MIEGELDIVVAQREALARAHPRGPYSLGLDAAHGRVLAEAPLARWDLPGGDVATMDGWAVRSADLLATDAPRVRLRRRGESAAGHPHEVPLESGEALRISTGALLPEGADAVVAQEDCSVIGEHVEVDRERVGASSSRPSGPGFTARPSGPEFTARPSGPGFTARPSGPEFTAGHFVRRAGSDVAVDSALLAAGTVLGAGGLALLAGCGHTSAQVHAPPRVAILCTGDELVPVGAWPQRGQVVSSNGLMLAWQAREAGGDVIDLGLARDEPASLRAALERGLTADVLITCGGISVGDHDLVLPTLIGLGAELVFRRVRLRPGRPTTLLQAPGAAGRPVLIFCLPGNPASAHVAFELFVRPALRRMQGHTTWFRPQRQVVLAEPAPRDARRVHMVRAVVVGERATPLPDQTSGALRSIAGHNALLELAPGSGPLAAGESVPALLLGDA